jgi:hypothetical protein
MKGSDLSAGDHLTVLGSNIDIDAGTDAQQSAGTQCASQFGVTLALGGVVGDTAASVNRSTAAAHEAHDPRLAAASTCRWAAYATGRRRDREQGKRREEQPVDADLLPHGPARIMRIVRRRRSTRAKARTRARARSRSRGWGRPARVHRARVSVHRARPSRR